jgi:hypothetical protein
VQYTLTFDEDIYVQTLKKHLQNYLLRRKITAAQPDWWQYRTSQPKPFAMEQATLKASERSARQKVAGKGRAPLHDRSFQVDPGSLRHSPAIMYPILNKSTRVSDAGTRSWGGVAGEVM